MTICCFFTEATNGKLYTATQATAFILIGHTELPHVAQRRIEVANNIWLNTKAKRSPPMVGIPT